VTFFGPGRQRRVCQRKICPKSRKVRSPLTRPANWAGCEIRTVTPTTATTQLSGTQCQRVKVLKPGPSAHALWALRLEGTVKHVPVLWRPGRPLTLHTAEGQIIAVEQETPAPPCWAAATGPDVYLVVTSPLHRNSGKLLVASSGHQALAHALPLVRPPGKLFCGNAPFTVSPSWSRPSSRRSCREMCPSRYASGSGEYAASGTGSLSRFQPARRSISDGRRRSMKLDLFLLRNDNPLLSEIPQGPTIRGFGPWDQMETGKLILGERSFLGVWPRREKKKKKKGGQLLLRPSLLDWTANV